LTMFPMTVSGVSNIAFIPFLFGGGSGGEPGAIPVTPHRRCSSQSARRYRRPPASRRG
jgi:hypothetical protein